MTTLWTPCRHPERSAQREVERSAPCHPERSRGICTHYRAVTRSTPRRYPFKASINSVAVAGQTTGSTAATVKAAATGAAAGVAIGAVLSGGDLDKIVAGGLLGAAAGTVISLGRGDVESVLPAGSTLTVQATETVAIR